MCRFKASVVAPTQHISALSKPFCMLRKINKSNYGVRLNEVKKHLQGIGRVVGGWEEITSCHASIRMCEEYVVSFPSSKKTLFSLISIFSILQESVIQKVYGNS